MKDLTKNIEFYLFLFLGWLSLLGLKLHPVERAKVERMIFVLRFSL